MTQVNTTHFKQFCTACVLIMAAMVALLHCNQTVAEPHFQVNVTQPYLDIRTGAGRSYPIHYVAQRGTELTILKRKAYWYKVSMPTVGQREIIGWVFRDDLLKTNVADSAIAAADHPRMKHAKAGKLKAGFLLGDLDNADSVAMLLAYQATPLIDTELHTGKWVGGTEEGWFVNGQLTYVPFRAWRVKPFASVGYGYLKRSARGANILQTDNSDNFLLAGSGLQVRFGKQYQLRLEYKHFNTLTSKNDNSELEQWQIGLSTTF